MFNWMKTAVLMAAIVGLFGVVGSWLGGSQGLVLALIFAGVMNIGAYWFSDSLVLRMYDAREVDMSTAPEFVGMVQDLAQQAGLPMPRVYIIQEDAPNAFATGRDYEHAAVAATTGLLRLLAAREVRGVMAHELAHVKHRDSEGKPVNPVVSILVMILAPLAASLIQMAISRAREFEADRGGAELCQDPLALADALTKLDHYAKGTLFQAAEAHPETAQMMIMNPLSGAGLAGLFSTHPSTEERVARLQALAGSMRA
ncbi:MAG: protease HtpX [Betaproteobacteria bacterium]|nr:protease HtpX [Betaproteobacteria bacterium]